MFYEPPGAASIPVPMEMFSWGWSATVAQNKNAQGNFNGTFDFVGDPTPKDASKVDGTAWNFYPTWTGVFSNVEIKEWTNIVSPANLQKA